MLVPIFANTCNNNGIASAIEAVENVVGTFRPIFQQVTKLQFRHLSSPLGGSFRLRLFQPDCVPTCLFPCWHRKPPANQQRSWCLLQDKPVFSKVPLKGFLVGLPCPDFQVQTGRELHSNSSCEAEDCSVRRLRLGTVWLHQTRFLPFAFLLMVQTTALPWSSQFSLPALPACPAAILPYPLAFAAASLPRQRPSQAAMLGWSAKSMPAGRAQPRTLATLRSATLKASPTR